MAGHGEETRRVGAGGSPHRGRPTPRHARGVAAPDPERARGEDLGRRHNSSQQLRRQRRESDAHQRGVDAVSGIAGERLLQPARGRRWLLAVAPGRAAEGALRSAGDTCSRQI